MRKYPIGVALLLAVASGSTAQAQEFENSSKKIKKGYELVTKGAFKDAIKTLNSIPYGDSLYTYARYELGLAYYADSQYNEALKTYTSILGNVNPIKKDLIIAIGNTYSQMNNFSAANAHYDSARALFPHDNRAYYESAVVSIKEKDYDRAIEQLQNSALINSFHTRSHLMLAYLYAQQGRLSESFLASMFTLSQSNDQNISGNVINLLSNLSDISIDIAKNYKNKDKKYANESFDEIDELMAARIIFNKDYKSKSKINDVIVKQYQLILEKLKYDKSDNNFAMQYYAPYFTHIEQSNLFDESLLYIFSELGIAEIDKMNSNKKAKNQLSQMHTLTTNYADQIVGTRELNYVKRNAATNKYIMYPKQKVFIVGQPLAQDKNKITGPATIYEDMSKIAEGEYNDKGERVGVWKFYYPDETLKLVEHYKNGHTRNAEKLRYYNNGNLATKITYSDANDLKERVDYTQNGIKKSEQYLDKLGNLVVTKYHKNGQLESTIVYQKDNLEAYVDGTYLIHHKNGQVRRKLTTVKDKLEGPYLEYYYDGTKQTEAFYKDGKLHGTLITYYPSGKIDRKSVYEQGKLQGESFEYYDHSDQYFTETYKNDVLNGPTTYYNKNKQAYGWKEYSDGKLISYKFHDFTGKEVASMSNNKGITTNVTYNQYGVLTDRTELNSKQEIHGTQLKNYANGVISRKTNYENGARHGESISYNDKGKKTGIYIYKEGKVEGPYTGYNEFDEKIAEGYLSDGEKIGTWEYYTSKGKPSGTSYYIDGEKNGHDSVFYYDGKVAEITTYLNGIRQHYINYTPDGKVINNTKYPLQAGVYKTTFANGDPKLEINLKNGFNHGSYKIFAPNKLLIGSYHYDMGDLEKGFKTWHLNGQLKQEGQYVNNELDGLFTLYDENGLVKETNHYKDGELEGTNTIYQNGVVTKVYQYKNGEKNGKATLFGADSTVVAYLYYEEDQIVGYSSQGKDGKETEFTPIYKGTGNVKTYYPNGQLALYAAWNNGYLHGNYASYFENGKLQEQRTYDNGNIIGPSKIWDANGTLVYDAMYNKYGLNGTLKRYDAKGNNYVTYSYVDNLVHGPLIIKDANGKDLTYTYHYDELIN